MTQFFLEVAHDQKPDAELVARRDKIAILFVELRELEQDHLRHRMLLDHAAETVGTAEHGNLVRGIFQRFLADDAHCPQAKFGLSPQPAAQLPGFGG